MKKIATLLILTINALFVSFWYFEYKYWCKFDNQKIIISLMQEDQDFQKCVDVLWKISYKIKEIEQNIKTASKYAAWGDIFWKNVLVENEKQKYKLQQLREDLLNKVEMFEKKYFEKIKKIIDNYIYKQKNVYLSEKKFILQQMNDYLRKGDAESYKKLRMQLDSIIVILTILDKVLISQNFEEMIPNLKMFLKLKKEWA